MIGNTLTLSTLTVSSINNGAPGVAGYSTMNVSSLNTMSSITTSSITTSSITTASGYNSISNTIYTTSGLQVGIGTSTTGANLHVYNSNSIFTTAPTVQIGDGQIDSTGTYGMLQLVRANGTADSKGHIAVIKNGISLFKWYDF
jgi:hypothetical protein